MQLFSSPTSPYARKVRILIAEKKLAERVEVVAANPLGEDVEALQGANPLGKIPALVLADGTALYDSRVIVDYLDGFATTPPLIPEGGMPRVHALRRQALADGVMDAAFSLVMEKRRPESQRSGEWMERWRGSILRGVQAMAPTGGFDIGDVAAAAALGYLDFRLPEIDWRAGAPALADLWVQASRRDSVASTAPPPA